jgi:acetyl-CoA carboxylase alpha subunit
VTDPILFSATSRVSYRKAADVYPFLESYIAKKEQEVADIEQMVERYEKRRMIEERAYQSMSTLRRLISGKKPDHHLAVEYIHYVKKPMEKVRGLRREIENARSILKSTGPADVVPVSDELANEMM